MMQKNTFFGLLFLSGILVTGVMSVPIASAVNNLDGGGDGGGEEITYACSDGEDNDGNGLTDYPSDLGCSSSTDFNESGYTPAPPTQCNDGADNDGNGPEDYPTDLGCSSAADTTEAGYSPAHCQDTLDNDNDGKVDLVDTGCTVASDTTEEPNPQCSDNIDNDLNGVKDYTADQGCSSTTDTTESGYTPPAVPGSGIVVYETQSKRDYYAKVQPDQLAHGGINETSAHGYPTYPVSSVSPTGQRICYLYDPTAYPTGWSLGGFDSPGGDYMAVWNPTTGLWVRGSANSFGNKRYNYITCKTLAPPDVSLTASDPDLKIRVGESVTLTWLSQYGALRKGTFSSTNFDTSILVPGHWETQVSYPVSCEDNGGYNDSSVMVQGDTKLNLALAACGVPEVEEVWVPDYNGPRPYGGSKSVSPSTTTTYTYTGTNSNGSNTSTVTIEVAGDTECTDLEDNDNDTLIDGDDPGCPGGATPTTPENSDLPDLTSGAVTQTTGTQGSATTLSATITNGGGSATSAGFTNLFQIDNNSDHATVYTTKTDTSPVVAKNGTDVTSTSYTFPTSGTWYVRVCADNNASWVGTVSEYNENNNCDTGTSNWHTVTIASNAPVASLSASPTGVPTNGSSVLTWTCTNSTSASINQGIGSVSPVAGGSVSTGPLTTTKSYTLTCTGSSGTQGFATVTVTQPVVTITATPAGLAKKGTTKTITWTSSADATSCLVSGPGISVSNSTLKNGSQAVTIDNQSTYTITCNGSTASVTVGLAPVFEEI